MGSAIVKLDVSICNGLQSCGVTQLVVWNVDEVSGMACVFGVVIPPVCSLRRGENESDHGGLVCSYLVIDDEVSVDCCVLEG